MMLDAQRSVCACLVNIGINPNLLVQENFEKNLMESPFLLNEYELFYLYFEVKKCFPELSINNSTCLTRFDSIYHITELIESKLGDS